MSLVEKIKAYANEHYTAEYGAQLIIETFEDAEIEATFETMEMAIDYMIIQTIQFEQNSKARMNNEY